MTEPTMRKPRRFSVQWFAQEATAWFIAFGIVLLMIAPEALIGPVG